MDGEGCFQFHRSATIKVDSTSKTTVEMLYALLGGSCAALKRKTERGRPVFRWVCHGQKALRVCELLEEYLVEKKKQAELLRLFYRFPPKSAMRESLKSRLSELKRTV